MAQGDNLGLDLGDGGQKERFGLVFVKEDLVSDRDTKKVVPGVGFHDLEEVSHLAGVGRVVLVDPETGDDLEVELLAFDRVEDVFEDLAVGSVETDTAGGLDKKGEFVINGLLGVVTTGELGTERHVGHAVEDLLQGVVGVGQDCAVRSNDYS